MRIEAIFLVGVAVFFAIVGALYWIWTAYAGGAELSGVLMLVGSFLLGLVPGSYYLWWSHRMRPRPEDRSDATIEEGSGVIGAFPSSSVWPFVMGMGLFLIALAAVFGYWLAAPGVALIVSAATGYTVESRRGGTV